jgi:hypothetical protein
MIHCSSSLAGAPHHQRCSEARTREASGRRSSLDIGAETRTRVRVPAESKAASSTCSEDTTSRMARIAPHARCG